MRRAVALAAAIVSLCASPASAGDGLCARLVAFYEAPFEQGVHFRSIDVHWIGGWLDLEHGWHLECRNTPDAAAKALCGWLPDNTSFEFPNSLPRRILECTQGIRLQQDNTEIDFEFATASIYTPDRYVRLVIDFRTREKPDRAIQLTAFESGPRGGHDEATDNVPPLFGPDNPVTER